MYPNPLRLKTKREGLFRPFTNSVTVEIGVRFWQAYANRNRHGFREGKLEKNDLVWLELNESGIQKKENHRLQDLQECDIESIQWARWGKKGMPLLESIPQSVHPDYLQRDKKNVSLVTDLFGQVPVNNPEDSLIESAPTFAGRIRTDNLVFENGINSLTDIEPLSVLASPHPGCLAFYREKKFPLQNHFLRGYKVYRTSTHALIDDSDAPRKYNNQGVYLSGGNLANPQQKVNFSAQLLNANTNGKLTLSVRSLSMAELALLLKICSATWRLGGGKPFGLGVCSVEIESIKDEFDGNVLIPQPEEYEKLLTDTILKRFIFWQATQKPVEFLRYPRAQQDNQKGGHVWFGKCAKVKKSGEMQSTYYECKTYPGQPLPEFNTDDINDDLLFGYDAIF
jgi:hypothetical protein